MGATYTLEMALTEAVAGVFTVDGSALDGTDGLTDTSLSDGTFTDISGDATDPYQVVIGTDNLMDSVQASNLTVTVGRVDDPGYWNPANPDSPLASDTPGLVPMRPVKLSATVDVAVSELVRGGGGVNEQQLVTINQTLGSYTLSFGGYTTGPIPAAALPAAVQAALQLLASIGAGNVAVYFATSQIQAAIMAQSPKLYWRLADAAGSANAADTSGNGNTGSYDVGVTLAEPGAIVGDAATSALFNNSSYARVTASTYAPYAVGSSRTFMGWAYQSASTDSDALFSGVLAATAGSPLLRIASGTTEVDWYGAENTGLGAAWTAAWPGTGQWVHWALTYNDSTGVAELFINGVSKGQKTVTSARRYNGAANDYFQVGSEGTGGGTGAWDGYQQDVALFEAILSAAQIQAIYNAGVSPVAAPMTVTFEGMLANAAQPLLGGSYITPLPVVTAYSCRGTWDSGSRSLQLYCEDWIRWASRVYPTIASTGPIYMGAVFRLLVAAVDPTLEPVADDGILLPDFSADGTLDVASILTNLLAVDLGTVYVARDGTPVYRQADYALAVDAAATVTITEQTSQEQAGFDVDDITTRILVEQLDDSGTPIQAYSDVDEAAELTFGRADANQISSSYVADPRALATESVRRGVQGKPPNDFTLADIADDGTTLLLILASAPLTVYSLDDPFGGTAGDVIVQRIQHTIQTGLHEAEVLAATREPDVSIFTVDGSALDGTDQLRYP